MMPEEKTLADRIAALASENPVFEGKTRVLSLETGGLEAILDEIDAAVLPTRLTFATDTGQLALDVAGRRLLRVAEGGGDVNVAENLLGATLSTEKTDDLKSVAALLVLFAGNAASLKLTAEPANGAARGDSVSVETIRSALGTPAAEETESPMDKLLAGCGDHIKAVLRLDGNTVAQTKGSIAHVQALKSALSGQMDGFLEARAKTCASHGDPSLTLLQATLAPGVGIGVAVVADERTLLAYDSAAVASIIAVWKTVL